MTLKAAVVGLGKQAAEDHIPGVFGSSSTELVAVCDIDPALVENHSKQWNVNSYTDFREMFATESLDMAIVAVPHHVGRSVVAAAAEKGVHVLKEKPFATSLAEARDLVEIFEGAAAAEHYQQALALHRQTNDHYGQARTLSNLGIVEERLENASPQSGTKGSGSMKRSTACANSTTVMVRRPAL